MEEIEKPSADKRTIGVKYGLISAVVGIVFFLVLNFAGQNPYVIKWGWAVSLTTTIVLIFLAHKEYKEGNNGFMTYGEGIAIGFWFTLVGVAVGMLFNYIYVTFIDPNIMAEFYESQYEQMQQKGMSDDQIEMASGFTKKLFWVFGTIGATFFSMATVLIVTIFTQKRPPEQR
jgi:ABC-type Fe3+-siderophore transport system permease subunit